ncbi:esterase/lipase family protein [Planctomycetota bacterium]
MTSDDPNQTVQADVIAHSMGGLVSRYAAMEVPGKPRLRIAHLFTIATPHQGALISIPPSPDPRARHAFRL